MQWTGSNFRALCEREDFQKLTASARFVFFALYTWSDTTDRAVYPSHQTISDVTGLNICTVRTGLRNLKRAGFIKSKQTYRSSNRYEFCVPESSARDTSLTDTSVRSTSQSSARDTTQSSARDTTKETVKKHSKTDIAAPQESELTPVEKPERKVEKTKAVKQPPEPLDIDAAKVRLQADEIDYKTSAAGVIAIYCDSWATADHSIPTIGGQEAGSAKSLWNWLQRTRPDDPLDAWITILRTAWASYIRSKGVWPFCEKNPPTLTKCYSHIATLYAATDHVRPETTEQKAADSLIKPRKL